MTRIWWCVIVLAVLLDMGDAAAMPREADTLVVIQRAEPWGLDFSQHSRQAEWNVSSLLHETLFRPREDLSVSPALARAWERIGQATWKISLRQDATFHNGEPVNAYAVKFSFDRIFDPSFRCPYLEKLLVFTHVKILDEYTLTISTEAPYAPGLYVLGRYLPIVPPGYIHAVGEREYNRRPIGCGPYRLVSWLQGGSVILERYDGYYGQEPAYRRILVRSIPDEASRIAALLSGEADVISDVSVRQRQAVLASGRAYLVRQRGNLAFLRMNTSASPFDDVRVRQAVNYSIDREAIAEVIFRNDALVCAGPLDAMSSGSTLSPYPFEPEKARRLLAEAGYPDGIEVPLTYTDLLPQMEAQLRMLASQLAAGGIRVVVERDERINPGRRHRGLRFCWRHDAFEPARSLYMLFHSSCSNGTYQNPDIDDLLDEVRSRFSRQERTGLFREIDRILYQDAPWAFLYLVPEVFAVATRVELPDRCVGFLDLRSAKPKE